MRLLLVEDDHAIAEPLIKGLEREGFVVTWVETGAAALAASPHDVVLLDLGLPDIDGTEVCRRIRATSDVPILAVTARGEEVDKVIGLELGADDYVVKPFGVRELVARIRAIVRRTQRSADANSHVVTVGDLEVDLRRHRVSIAGEEIHLTPKEFDLLALLASDAGATFERESILDQVWDTNWFGPTKTLDVHIAALRAKLGDRSRIETVRGVGFRLAEAPGS